MASSTKNRKKSKKPESKAKRTSKKSNTKTKPKVKSKAKAKIKAGKKAAIPLDKKGVITIAICLAFVIAIVICAVALHGADRGGKTTGLNIDKDVAWGIDVSAHNGDIDWGMVSEEADFAFIRVGYRGYSNGSISLDKKAKENLKNAKKAAMPVGVYFYSQAITPEEAKEEAEFVLDFIKSYNVTLPVVIDYEYAYKDGRLGGRLFDADLSKSDGGKVVSAFCKTISGAGYTPAVYASTNFYETKISTKELSKDTVIWVADYNKKITYFGDYDIWQYAKTGSCKGVSSKHVDTNYWYLKK